MSQALGGVSDAGERDLLVVALLRARPAQAPSLCPMITNASTRAWCAGLSQRPHLLEPAPVMPTEAPRATPGASSTTMVPSLESPLARLTPANPDPCADGAEGCREGAAWRLAARGDVSGAARICMGEAAGTWRDECFFRAAEGMIGGRSVARYGDTVDLCMAAGHFTADCLGHAEQSLAEGVPSSQRGPAAWGPLVARAQGIGAAWRSRAPAFGDYVVGRYWAVVLDISYQSAPVVTGDPLDALPAEATPHVRASAAARLAVLDSNLWSAGLDGAVWRLGAALQARSRGGAQGSRTVTQMSPTLDLWMMDRPGDERFPALAYRRGSRRTASSDSSTDLAICLVEAAARQRPAVRAVLEQAAQSTDPALRWTGERLLEPLEEGPPPSEVALPPGSSGL